jgi:hypothetical protein
MPRLYFQVEDCAARPRFERTRRSCGDGYFTGELNDASPRFTSA